MDNILLSTSGSCGAAFWAVLDLRPCAGEVEEVAAMERDFLKSVLAVRKLEAEVRQAVEQVRHGTACPDPCCSTFRLASLLMSSADKFAHKPACFCSPDSMPDDAAYLSEHKCGVRSQS